MMRDSGAGSSSLRKRSPGKPAVLPRPGLTRSLGAAVAILFAVAVGPAEEPSLLDATGLYADRSSRVRLERADRYLQSGETADGVAVLQSLLDAPRDTFLNSPNLGGSDPPPLGLRTAVEEILQNASPATRQWYVASQAGRADALLREATASHDRQVLGEVVRRFPGTSSAEQALNRLAREAFDRGEFGTAARLWSQALSGQLVTGDVSPTLVAHTIMALRHAGQEATASRLVEQFAGLTVTVRGNRAPLHSLLAMKLSRSESLPTTASPFATGSDLTPPAFPPVWKHDAGTGTPDFLELWAAARHSEGRPAATPATAVIAAGQLFVREPSSLVAYELESGSQRWQAQLAGDGEPPDEDTHYANLHELTQLEGHYASNGPLAGLSSDGERIYVLDRDVEHQRLIRTASHTRLPESSGQSGSETNRLLAFWAEPAEGDNSPQPIWIAGGAGGSSGAAVLSGHRFLGAPVVAQGRLLAITERQQGLQLVALDATSGALLWHQPLGYVPRAANDDPLRAAGACSPAVADGIAVCSTNAGFVAAVDFVTGRLLWAYEYGGAFGTESAGRSGRTVHLGDPAVASATLIRQGKVVLLPQDSGSVHCLDLLSGEVLWSVSRDDALALACLTDEAAILLGRSSLRSLSMSDGNTDWTARLGKTAGTGVATESHYLLPLESGTIAAVEIATGHRVGFDLPRQAAGFQPVDEYHWSAENRSRWRPGNLFTDGDSLYSVGAFGVLRLETSASALAEAAPADADPQSMLASARLALAAGRLDAAQPRLETLHKTPTDKNSAEMTARLLRELLFLKLQDAGHAERPAIIAKLDELSETPQARARFLLEATADALAAGQMSLLREQMAELATTSGRRTLAVPNDATHLVSPTGWLHELTAQLPESSAAPVEPGDLTSATVDDLEQRLFCLPQGESADRLRIELARRLIDDREFHRAELHLLHVAKSGAGAGTVEPDVLASLDRLRRRSGLAEAGSAMPVPNRPLTGVRIREQFWSPADSDLCRTFGQSRRLCLSRGRNPFRVVDIGDTRRARLAVVDLQRGFRFKEIGVDARLRFPSLERQPRDGHFLPVITADRVYGLSFLEARSGKPVWSTELPESSSPLPQIGPYGASYLTVQSQQELTVLDPADGTVLWRRTALPIHRRFPGSRTAELFGDEQALVLLNPEDGRYTVYRPQTGRELSRGWLAPESLGRCRVIGRKLCMIVSEGERSVVRLWDPLNLGNELEIPFEGSLLETKTRDDLLVLLFRDGRLLVVDPAASQVTVRIQIEPALASQVRALQAFSDDERHYISLYLPDPEGRDDSVRPRNVYDTPLTTEHVQGQWLAIDRMNGRKVWSRPIERRTILDPVDHPSPVLVALARIDDRRGLRRRTLLVEAIDPATGTVLGRNETLIPDQLLQAKYDPATDRITLSGMTSTISLEIGREEAPHGFAALEP